MVSWSKIAEVQPLACAQLDRAFANDRMHHATLCAGPVVADIATWVESLSLALVCQAPNRPEQALQDGCETCPACRKVQHGNHPDVHHLHPNDKNAITVDAIRALSAKLGLSRHEAPYAIVVIHKADAMAPAAQNALLKTLEEPTANTLFFLMTQRSKAMLPTIRSRCLLVRLAPAAAAQHEAALEAAQIAPALWPLLIRVCAAQPDLAQTYAEQDIAAAWQTLKSLAGGSSPPTEVFKVAADYGAARPTCDMLLALIELHVHTVLAAAHGAPLEDERLRTSGSPVAAARVATLLQRARAQKNLHMNRVLLLESMLFALTELTVPNARMA
jgi:DNA polymerase III delta' subunit